jgi:hypothetical protein
MEPFNFGNVPAKIAMVEHTLTLKRKQLKIDTWVCKYLMKNNITINPKIIYSKNKIPIYVILLLRNIVLWLM